MWGRCVRGVAVVLCLSVSEVCSSKAPTLVLLAV